MAWFRQVKRSDWAKPAEIKRDIRSVSILRDDRAVFNIAGNKYRVVVSYRCRLHPVRRDASTI